MKYKELTVYTNTFGSEIVAEILRSAGSEGVYIYDSDDLKGLLATDIIWDYVEESLLVHNEIVRVCGCFYEKIFAKVLGEVAEELDMLKQNAVCEVGSLEQSVSDIDDQDWWNVWKKYYKPIETESVIVVPEWINYKAKDERRLVKMNPGMAFGTGEHESTRMCLDLLSSVDVVGKNVVDIGCGSGILGISAIAIGARFCDFYDIDEIALDSTKENVALNDFADKVAIAKINNLEKNDVKASLIFANITADVLIAFSKTMGKNLAKDGKIILSGIINERRKEVIEAYNESGFKVIESVSQGEWQGLLLGR